jgi:hypothetical protein
MANDADGWAELVEQTTGRDPMMTLRMPVGLRKTIDRWAASKDVTR